MEYSFFPRGRAKESAFAKGRGVCMVGVCPKRLPFWPLLRDTLVGVLFLRCSLFKTRIIVLTYLSISNIHTLCLLSSRHTSDKVAQLPIVSTIYAHELVCVQRRKPWPWTTHDLIWQSVNRAVRRLLASDSETFHSSNIEVGSIHWRFRYYFKTIIYIIYIFF